MSGLHLDRPWLTFDLGGPLQVFSWAINRPGFVTAQRIVWREVRNADLPRDLNVRGWLDSELDAQSRADCVAFLTSRDVTRFTDITSAAGSATARCIATVGLSNAERVGHRRDHGAQEWGTINIAVRLNLALSQTGLIEALSIAAQARTVAIMEAGVPLPTGLATGTGTDCIAVAAPDGPLGYAGLHTEIGEAIGSAVYRATLQGAEQWKIDVNSEPLGVRTNARS